MMRLTHEVITAARALVNEMQVSFPVGASEAQKMVAMALELPSVVRVIRAEIAMKTMEVCDEDVR